MYKCIRYHIRVQHYITFCFYRYRKVCNFTCKSPKAVCTYFSYVICSLQFNYITNHVILVSKLSYQFIVSYWDIVVVLHCSCLFTSFIRLIDLLVSNTFHTLLVKGVDKVLSVFQEEVDRTPSPTQIQNWSSQPEVSSEPAAEEDTSERVWNCF